MDLLALRPRPSEQPVQVGSITFVSVLRRSKMGVGIPTVTVDDRSAVVHLGTSEDPAVRSRTPRRTGCGVPLRHGCWVK